MNAAFDTQTSVAQRTALAADAPLPPRTGDGSQAGPGGFNPAILMAAAALALGAFGVGLLKFAKSR
jgi:hypothetical protein